MYEDLSQEELEVVLEAGLEKVAYEEGVNEYINSLEKVASVHEVDPEDLHDFLEKVAEETDPKWKKWGRRGAGLGAGLGAAGFGGLGLQGLKGSESSINNLKDVAGLASLGATFGGIGGGLLGTGAGALQPKEKQAEEKGKIQKAKKWAKENPTKTLAGVGALAGAGLGARKGYRSGQGYLDARRDMAQQAKEILGDSDLHLSPKQEKLRLALQTGSYGAAGGSLGAGAGALTGLGINKLRRNKKEEN